MKKTYYPTGVCSKQFDLEVENGIITFFQATGGCAGNLGGIKALITGMPAESVITLLKGTKCGKRSTSCPDQISKALESILAEEMKSATEE